MSAPLPIDPLLPQVVSALRSREALVLEAPPGAGKTTRVPRALLESGLTDQEIVVLQPRRLATRLAAARVADELGTKLGGLVGYQVRFDDVTSQQTRLRFLTEGLLTRRLVTDPTLEGVGVVVLDEFHERHLATDLALAMLRRLQRSTRPELKLVVMSATLDAEPIAAWLGDAPRLRSEGRRFDVALEHLEREDDRPLEQQVLGALKRLVQAELDGHVLVFLPGAAEIRRAQDACQELARRHGLELHVLHGDLPPAEQDRALRPSSRRKVILSTNVAETSVTIDGIAAVIDSGLARVAVHSPWSGLPGLKVAKVSKSSAIQRAGRAGRTRAGTCVRLYTRADFEGRPQADAPELRRLELSEALLGLRALGVDDPKGFEFFEPPTPAAIEAGEQLLARLGATTPTGALTPVGRALLALPVGPRLGRVIVEAERRGYGLAGVHVAALLGERDLRLETRTRFGDARGAHGTSGPSDVLELYERYEHAQAAGARSANVDERAVGNVGRVVQQLRRHLRAPGKSASGPERDEALRWALLAGFGDRVAKRRRPKSPEVVFAAGGAGTLDPTSVVHDADWLVAVDAEERRGQVVVRLASSIEPEWLLDSAALPSTDEAGLEWSASGRRVEQVTRLSFGALAIEETRRPAEPSPEASALLFAQAKAQGLASFVDPQALASWCCRVDSVRQGFPEAGLPAPDQALLDAALAQACEGLRSFKELEEAGVLAVLDATLGANARLVAQHAPERITLPSGRSVKVNYEAGKPPWIESRLQDFFGLLKGPSIGRAPLVLHLLAPNMRAVQVTTDLAGFWDRHYPAIRKELMRQYPRHAWPEDPKTATPPAPRPPRR